MAHPQVADGGDGLQIWKLPAIILKNSRRQQIKVDPPVWELGVGITTYLKDHILLEVRVLHRA
jgi:hypothetical protein